MFKPFSEKWRKCHTCQSRSVSSVTHVTLNSRLSLVLFQWSEIRNQLVEQFKCLEQQSESRIQLLQDLQEFFRRKAEIELEYSRSLDKLAERFSSKIRSSREHQLFK